MDVINFEFHVPWPPKELSPNARNHWAVKSKVGKTYKKMCYFSAISVYNVKLIKGDKPSAVEINMRIEFSPPNSRRRDIDNCIASFKYGLDGVADALGVDDRIFSIVPIMSSPDIRGRGNIKIKASVLYE